MTSVVMALFTQLPAGQLDEQIFEARLFDSDLADLSEGRRHRHELRQLALRALYAEEKLIGRRLDHLHVAHRADRGRYAFRPEGAAQRDDLALAGRLAKLPERAFGKERAVIDDCETITETLSLIEVVCGVDDGRIGANEADEIENRRA